MGKVGQETNVKSQLINFMGSLKGSFGRKTGGGGGGRGKKRDKTNIPTSSFYGKFKGFIWDQRGEKPGILKGSFGETKGNQKGKKYDK